MLEQIKARITEIETAITQLVANHATLTGHLAEAKHFLDMATKVADEVAPGNPVTDVLDVVDHVVDEVFPG
jgi:hypothetical protein